MSSWEGKSQAHISGFRFFVFLLKTFGLGFSYFILRFVALYYFLFSVKSSKHILSFYRKHLGYGTLVSLKKLYKNYYFFGQTIIDKVCLISGINTKFTFDFDGENYLHEMVAQKKGGILLSAHAGNWEAAGHLLERINTKVNIVMYDGEDEGIKKYLESVEGEKNYKVIYVKKDLSHIYKINEALGANEIVCMHADRFMPDNKTITTTFLGEDARFPEGPFLLALKLKVHVAFVFSFKESARHYHFYSTELKNFYLTKETTVKDILADFIVSLENMVRKHPEQWFNYYDFWEK